MFTCYLLSDIYFFVAFSAAQRDIVKVLREVQSTFVLEVNGNCLKSKEATIDKDRFKLHMENEKCLLALYSRN